MPAVGHVLGLKRRVSCVSLQVTGIAVSPRHPYMFSCGLDKMVKCWDLETNKVRTPTRATFRVRDMFPGLSAAPHQACFP